MVGDKPVIGVLGGSGGVGASSFAAALAAAAGAALLVDLDSAGGGLDVLLGIETRSGARWSGVRLAGGRLDSGQLLAGLPRWGPVAVLAADLPELDASAVRQVLGAAADSVLVVADLPRTGCPVRAAALLHCDLVVVLARADVIGVVAAHAAVTALPELPIGVVVRRSELSPVEVVSLVGRPLLGVLPAARPGRPESGRYRPARAALRVAAGILDGVRAGNTDRSVVVA